MVNYYFEPKENIIKDKYADKYNCWLPKITICKTSTQYPPVFCSKHNLFFDFKELEMFYDENQDFYTLKDGDDREYTFEKFEEKVKILKEYSQHGDLLLRKDEYGYLWED